MRGAMQRDRLPGLSGYRNQMIGGDMVYEQRIPALANCQVDRLVSAFRELLQVFLRDTDQHRPPLVAVGESPQGRSENEVLTARRIGEEASPFQGEGEPENAAAVNSNQVRQLV
jgi:hypothetical protein